jgi:hypothetical protein
MASIIFNRETVSRIFNRDTASDNRMHRFFFLKVHCTQVTLNKSSKKTKKM